MNPKKTLFLAVVLVALAAYIYKIEIPNEEIETKKAFLYQNVSKSDVEEISIHKEKETIVLKNTKPETPAKKEGDLTEPDPAWEIASIPGAAVDKMRMNSLLSAVIDLKSEAQIPENELEKDLSIYGLEKPALTVDVKSSKGTASFELGKKNDFVSGRYLRIKGKPEVYLVRDSLFESANKTTTELREKALIKFTNSDIQAVSVSEGKSPKKFERSGADSWKIVEPISGTGSNARISELLLGLNNVRVTEFKDEESPKSKTYKLDSPAATVELTFKDQSKPPLKVTFGKVKDDLWFSLDGKQGVYKTGLDIMTKLSKPLSEYREKSLFQFEEGLVKDITVSGKSELKIEKAGNDWKVNGKEGDAQFITQYLRDLSQLQASDFPSPNANLGLNTPRDTVTIGLDAAGQRKERKLVIGSETKEGSFVGVDDLKEPFIVSSDSLKKILPREEVLVKTAPTPSAA